MRKHYRHIFTVFYPFHEIHNNNMKDIIILWLLKLGITMLIHNKDDIEFVTEFPCFLGHPGSRNNLLYFSIHHFWWELIFIHFRFMIKVVLETFLTNKHYAKYNFCYFCLPEILFPVGFGPPHRMILSDPKHI